MQIKTKPLTFTERLLTVVLAILLPFATLPAQAVIIENLPVETTAYTGYTHRAIITFGDLAASANTIQTITLLPSGTSSTNLGTNILVGPVGYVISQQFSNNIANNTNLLMYIGIGGGPVETGTATNSFFSAIDIDARTLAPNQKGDLAPTWTAHTNATFAVASGSNNIVAVFKQVGGTPLLSGVVSGKMAIYFRAVDMNALKP